MIENFTADFFLGVERLVAEGCFTAAYPLHVVRVVCPSRFMAITFRGANVMRSWGVLKSHTGFIRSGKIREKLCFKDSQEMSGNFIET